MSKDYTSLGPDFGPESFAADVDESLTGYACVGTDLDRTMLYSANSMNVPSVIPSNLVLKLVELHNFKPLSYMTNKACENLQTITRLAGFVPVTTRTEDQFKRIFVPGVINDTATKQPQYAVTTNGAKILVNGNPDMQWHEFIMSQFEDSGVAPFSEVRKYLEAFSGMSGIERLRDAEGIFFTMNVKLSLLPKLALNNAVHWMESHGWKVSVQGKKIYFVPNFINKGSAFKEVVSRINPDYTMTAGDSSLDISLFEVSDIALRPRHGELEDAEYNDAVTVTNTTGIFAGEEITERWMAQINASM